MSATRSKPVKKRIRRKLSHSGSNLLYHAKFFGVEQLGPTDASKILYDKLRHAWKLSQIRDKIITASNYALRIGLGEECHPIGVITQHLMDKIRKLGFNGADSPRAFKHKMKVMSDFLSRSERELSEELDARPKLDMTVEQIGRLGKARCGTLLRKMPMRLNVTLEQEEAIRARYASLEETDCAFGVAAVGGTGIAD